MPGIRSIVPIGLSLAGALIIAGLTGYGPDSLAALARPNADGTGRGANITDTASLNRAIRTATGPATLVLAPGTYDAIVIATKSGITLRSASPSNPAVLRGLTIRGSSNITVDNITIAGANTGLQYRLYVFKSSGVTLGRIDIPGSEGTFDEPLNTAIMIRSSQDVTLDRFAIAWAWHGVSFLDCTNLTIRNGVIRDIRTDGIRGGGVQGLAIQGNDIGRFHPAPGDHPDGIQLWSTNQATSARDIVIRDNLVSRDGGGIAQGIFIRDTHLKLPFHNVTVAGNVIAGSMYNGIAISGAINATFENNTVIGYPDMKSWIRVDHGQDVTVQDNATNRYLLSDGVTSRRNRVVPEDRKAADQAASAWRQAHGR